MGAHCTDIKNNSNALQSQINGHGEETGEIIGSNLGIGMS